MEPSAIRRYVGAQRHGQYNSSWSVSLPSSSQANDRLYAFDKADDERHNCKIGVIFQRANQLEDYDILCNDGLSDQMSEFLAQISARVNLKGFDKYRADLDVTNGLHGDCSYYTDYENHEIMFNVAPLIPTSKTNGQCLHRKGLVGNAFVCVVFQEPGAIFMPDRIAGRVTQLYITVQPMYIQYLLYYKVNTRYERISFITFT